MNGATTTGIFGRLAMILVTATAGCRIGPKVSPSTPERVESRAERARLPAQSRSKRSSVESPIRLVSATQDASAAPPLAPAIGPTRLISLAEAIAQSLAQNPELVALRENEPVSLAALENAETYPFNPYVQVQATPYQDNTPDGRTGTIHHYVLLMQTIQLARQQQFREEGASASLNGVRWNIRQAELLNVAQTERLYLTAAYLRGVRDLTRALARNNDELLRTVEKQLGAGEATGADAAIVRLDTRSTRQQARLAEANYEAALRDLRRQLGIDPAAPVEPSVNLLSLRCQPATAETLCGSGLESGALGDAVSTESVVVSLAATRPDVLAARSDLDTARAGASLHSSRSYCPAGFASRRGFGSACKFISHCRGEACMQARVLRRMRHAS